MWALDNRTPFAAERCWVRDEQGAEVWLVAVRAAFDIREDGALRLAEPQEPVVLAPRFRGDASSSSLLEDTDVPHMRDRTDVLVEGSAYAPGGRPATRVDVRLRLGAIDKTLRVTGDRVWRRTLFGLRMSRPEKFLSIPLVYERASGGSDRSSEDPSRHAWDERNPVGRGFVTRRSRLAGQLAPNVEYPSDRVRDTKLFRRWRQRVRPAGFGPIAGHWSPRRELSGTYDAKWESTRQPLLPTDFDRRYYQSAPVDQQLEARARAGDRVELSNMTPDGRLSFRLPRVLLGFSTRFFDGKVVHHRPALHTVLIRPDTRQLVLVWHTHLECHHDVLQLATTRITLKKRVRTFGEPWIGEDWQPHTDPVIGERSALTEAP